MRTSVILICLTATLCLPPGFKVLESNVSGQKGGIKIVRNPKDRQVYEMEVAGNDPFFSYKLKSQEYLMQHTLPNVIKAVYFEQQSGSKPNIYYPYKRITFNDFSKMTLPMETKVFLRNRMAFQLINAYKELDNIGLNHAFFSLESLRLDSKLNVFLKTDYFYPMPPEEVDDKGTYTAGFVTLLCKVLNEDPANCTHLSILHERPDFDADHYLKLNSVPFEYANKHADYHKLILSYVQNKDMTPEELYSKIKSELETSLVSASPIEADEIKAILTSEVIIPNKMDLPRNGILGFLKNLFN